MRNLSSPRARWRHTDPMAAYDRLPGPLRRWAAEAALPWSAASLLHLWRRAIAETGCAQAACARLTRAERSALSREARQVWGPSHPAAHLGYSASVPTPFDPETVQVPCIDPSPATV